MNRQLKLIGLTWLKYDLPAGFSVFLVALPLCLGIALASGAPLYAGLLSGIIGGIIVGAVSGSHLGVSGPAAGLTTLVSAAIVSLGDYRVFLLAVMIAGAFQLIMGLLKLGTIALYFPSSVIKGMLAAIGIILISKQIPVALGYDHPDFWESGFPMLIESFTIDNFKHLFSKGAVLVTVVSLLALIIMQQPFAKKIKFIPAPLMAVLIGVVTAIIFHNATDEFYVKETQLVHIPNNVFGDITFPDFSKLLSSVNIWKDGLTIGLLASLETLLCVEAIDKMDKQNRITPVNRELVAQGIGNLTCGLLGAIPMTAVVVRGSANVNAGARTKMSVITHGAFLLIAVLVFPFLLNKIPYASLAAILLITGFNLAKPKLFKGMWKLGLKQFLPFIITIIVILATDLLVGVLIGLLISIYFIIQNNFVAQYKLSHKVVDRIHHYTIKLNNNVSFLNKVSLRKTLDEFPEYSVVTIDGTESSFIDYDILEIISEFSNKAKYKHIELHLDNVEVVTTSAVH